MSDEENGLAQLLLWVQKFAMQVGTRERIESAERLVHQKNRRIGSKCAGDADALTLPTGKLMRITRGDVTVEANQLDEFFDALCNSFLRPVFDCRDEADVALNGEMWKKSDFLDHISDVAAQLDYVPLASREAFHTNFTIREIEQTIHQLKCSGLARAAAAEQHKDFAALDSEIQVTKN